MCCSEILAACVEVNMCGIVYSNTLVNIFYEESHMRKMNGITPLLLDLKFMTATSSFTSITVGIKSLTGEMI